MASTLGSGYRRARDIARRLGIGRIRDRGIEAINALSFWTAVPPHRLKDFDAKKGFAGRHVALTFDDGPNPDVTPQILELLASFSARATFFMCGLSAERDPDLVREVVRAGHSIGGHSWDHPHSGVRNLSTEDWQLQVDQTHELLGHLSGGDVLWFRPPRGITDRRTWSALRDQGLTTVMWSVDAWDCKLRDPEKIAAGVLSELEPGGIVLLHDNNATFLYSKEKPSYGENGNQQSTIRATQIILEELSERGLTSVSLGDLPTQPMPAFGRPRFLL